MGTGIVTAKILSVNLSARECLVEIYDDENQIARGNIGLELNPDGTANMEWIKTTISNIVKSRRKVNTEDHSKRKIKPTIKSKKKKKAKKGKGLKNNGKRKNNI